MMAGCRRKLVTLKTADGVVHDIVLNKYVGHLESKERLRIQPAQLFHFS